MRKQGTNAESGTMPIGNPILCRMAILCKGMGQKVYHLNCCTGL